LILLHKGVYPLQALRVKLDRVAAWVVSAEVSNALVKALHSDWRALPQLDSRPVAMWILLFKVLKLNDRLINPKVHVLLRLVNLIDIATLKRSKYAGETGCVECDCSLHLQSGVRTVDPVRSRWGATSGKPYCQGGEAQYDHAASSHNITPNDEDHR
jgi:hypothetical protein